METGMYVNQKSYFGNLHEKLKLKAFLVITVVNEVDNFPSIKLIHI